VGSDPHFFGHLNEPIYRFSGPKRQPWLGYISRPSSLSESELPGSGGSSGLNFRKDVCDLADIVVSPQAELGFEQVDQAVGKRSRFLGLALAFGSHRRSEDGR
jgi:hypothetical protein